MVISKFNEPWQFFTVHGMKTIGDYIYVLGIDMVGQAIIQRVKGTGSNVPEILFTFRETNVTIADFWLDPTPYIYKYMYQL